MKEMREESEDPKQVVVVCKRDIEDMLMLELSLVEKPRFNLCDAYVVEK